MNNEVIGEIEIQILDRDEDGDFIARVKSSPFPALNNFNAFGDSKLKAFKELCCALQLGCEVLLEEEAEGGPRP